MGRGGGGGEKCAWLSLSSWSVGRMAVQINYIRGRTENEGIFMSWLLSPVYPLSLPLSSILLDRYLALLLPLLSLPPTSPPPPPPPRAAQLSPPAVCSTYIAAVATVSNTPVSTTSSLDVERVGFHGG